MTHRMLGKILACMLAVVLPAATMSAETPAAMLYASGTVTLNGVGSERSSAIFAGDSIQTPASGLVTLTAEGSTVLVGPSSVLVYQGTAVDLGSGTAMITTDRAMKTQVQRLVITPAAPGRSSYRVSRGEGKLMIAALHGPLKVSDGSNDSLIAEGDTATMPDQPDTPGATPGATTSGLGISKRTGLIVLGIAALAGALLVIETTKEPVSGSSSR
jgi:hypothetical protein